MNDDASKSSLISKKCIFVLIFFIFCIKHSMKWKHDSIVENCPVDVVYKYIDLTDKRLKRKNIKQIGKDYDANNELKYSIRSVLTNLPWVRKIFIIMPNKDIYFLKNSMRRKDKIVYIKDKDLLGFDSSSCTTFEDNGLWRLDKFNVSDLFIYLNDDYFIRKKLKKTDFFYYSENEKRVVPYVMVNTKLNTNSYQKVYDYFWENHELLNSVVKQRGKDYIFQMVNSYRLLYKVLNNTNISLPNNLGYSWHNAVPFSLMDLKEMYYLIKDNYEYADECFNARYRMDKQLIMLALDSFYYLNKNKREKCKIKSFYTRLDDFTRRTKIKGDVFCINTGEKKVKKSNLYYERRFLDRIYPKKTIYEIDKERRE